MEKITSYLEKNKEFFDLLDWRLLMKVINKKDWGDLNLGGKYKTIAIFTHPYQYDYYYGIWIGKDDNYKDKLDEYPIYALCDGGNPPVFIGNFKDCIKDIVKLCYFEDGDENKINNYYNLELECERNGINHKKLYRHAIKGLDIFSDKIINNNKGIYNVEK